MSEALRKKGFGRNALGRGLSALISSPPVPLNAEDSSAAPDVNYAKPLPAHEESDQGDIKFLGIDKIIPNPTQPRQHFSAQEINELSDSIKSLGVLQPLLVRASASQSGMFEIIAGERRWRASKQANLSQVPVIIHKIDDSAALQIAIVENVQRENLNAIEEAQAYQRLMDEFQLSQQEVAEKVGKERATVANLVRLLKLPDEVIKLIRENALSIGHAKAILSIKEPSAQVSLAKKVVKENLSVRALETIIARVVVLDSGKRLANKPQAEAQEDELVSPQQFQEVIDRMRNSLATKVSIRHHQSGRGRIEIEYFSESELDRLVEHICSEKVIF